LSWWLLVPLGLPGYSALWFLVFFFGMVAP